MLAWKNTYDSCPGDLNAGLELNAYPEAYIQKGHKNIFVTVHRDAFILVDQYNWGQIHSIVSNLSAMMKYILYATFHITQSCQE